MAGDQTELITRPVEGVLLKEHVLGLANERDKRYASQFESIREQQLRSTQAVADAFNTANSLISKAATDGEKRVDAAMAAVEKATIKSEAAIEKRFESVNEFRQQLADQQATFARKAEVELALKAVNDKTDQLMSQLQLTKGHSSGFNAAWGILITVVTLLLSSIGIILAMTKR